MKEYLTSIATMDKSKSKDIYVVSNPKEMLPIYLTTVGLMLIASSIGWYITANTAFKHGVRQSNIAEFDGMVDIGLIDP